MVGSAAGRSPGNDSFPDSAPAVYGLRTQFWKLQSHLWLTGYRRDSDLVGLDFGRDSPLWWRGCVPHSDNADRGKAGRGGRAPARRTFVGTFTVLGITEVLS